MTEKKERQALIHIEYKGVVKPFVDATALALTFGVPAAIIGYFWIGLATGSSVSLGVYWWKGNISTPKTTQRSPRNAGPKINVNGKPWTFDQVAPGQFVTRQSVFADFLDLLGRRPRKPTQRNATPAIPKPRWMEEQVFHSHYNGYPFQILVQDAFRFLREAQKLQRGKGKGAGLSERTWVRKADDRPLWYQELPNPAWYWAMRNLLDAVERCGGKQLIVDVGPRQIALAREASQVLEALRWLEGQRTNDQNRF